MPAPIGNKYWQLRKSHGRKPTFRKASDLWEKCVEYFEWIEQNPLLEQKAFHTAGIITKTDVSKMRAMTITGLCLFLGIDYATWLSYKKRKGFIAITTRVEDIIYEQKFTGAAAELLNPNIIARDLGLRDKQDVKQTGDLKVTIIDSFPEDDG